MYKTEIKPNISKLRYKNKYICYCPFTVFIVKH